MPISPLRAISRLNSTFSRQRKPAARRSASRLREIRRIHNSCSDRAPICRKTKSCRGLLFGAPSGQLSPTQALALGQAAAIYSGGNDALEGLRRSLGFGAASSSNNPLNKFLGDRVSLGVHTGATPAQTGVGMSVTIYKQLKAKGAIDATGGASVGAGAEYEW